MAKRKNFYYVLVMTDEGPVFVTDILPNKWASYEKTEKPMEFGSKEYANDVALGLTLNFNLAYMVVTPYEIEGQPYLYSDGKLVWKSNK